MQLIKLKIILKFVIFVLTFLNIKCLSKNLRIISYNINYNIPWDKKKESIIKLFKELNPDIICLQEIETVQHMKEIAKKLNMYWHNKTFNVAQLAILTKQKPINFINIDIPHSYYNSVIAIKIKPNIWISSIHLSSVKFKQDDTERLRELDFILKALNKLKTKNIIIAGDFNSMDHSKVSKLLKLNSYFDSHENKPWRKGTWMPSKNFDRIDRIHLKGNFKILDGKVIDHNDIDWLKKIGWPTGNDHRLVLTDLIY